MQKYTSIIKKLFELYFRVHFKLATKIFDILILTFDFRQHRVKNDKRNKMNFSIQN